jgi:hypothetical protein
VKPDLRSTRRTPADRRRRLAAGVLSGVLALSAAAGLAQGLASCRPAASSRTDRPLSAAEADRLAGMRLRNYRDGLAGVRATIGRPGRQLRVTGWVDWRRALAYLSVTGPAAWRGDGAPADLFRRGGPARPAAVDGLVQAAPGVMATRAGGAAGRPGDGTPPVVPPGDGWTVRRMTLASPADAPLDAFAALLFTIASGSVDGAGALASSDARWMRRDITGGTPVDVLIGPAVPPAATAGAAPTSLAGMGGAVRYWLDGASRVHRLEALLATDLPVRVDLVRNDRRRPAAIAALGGRPISPRAVNRREADALAWLRRRNRDAGGGRITLVLPSGDGVVRGAGWVDWRVPAARLRLTGPGHPAPGTVLRAGARGVAIRRAPKSGYPGAGAAHFAGRPGAAWQFSGWAARADKHGAYDLELLISELLALSAPARDPVRPVRAAAGRLRTDRLRGAAVTVFELPKRSERRMPRGRARLRYWLAGDGVLRRLELRTRSGVFAQLDVVPGTPPGGTLS